RAEIDAHRVEPEVGADLAAQVVPAVELGPVALAAPAVIAVAGPLDAAACAADRDRPGHRSPLLDVTRDLVEAHAGRMRIAVGGARRLPNDVEPRAAGGVAETKTLEGALPVDRDSAEREPARFDRWHGRTMIDRAVHHRAALRDEEKEIRLAEVRVDADAEHDTDVTARIVEGKPEALVPQRERVLARNVSRVVLGGRHMRGARHHDPPIGSPGGGIPRRVASRWVQGLLVSRSG